jgi:hypothetical protein
MHYRRHDHTHGVCAYTNGTIRWNATVCEVYVERGARDSILRAIEAGREQRRHEKMAKEIRTLEAETP